MSTTTETAEPEAPVRADGKVRDAAASFRRLSAWKAEHAAELKELATAERTLKEYFAASGKSRYGDDIVCIDGTTTRFDQAKAKELLGPAKVDECTVTAITRKVQLV